MKICYVLHQFLPHYFTGTEQYAFALAREIGRRGHEVDVFTLDPAFGNEEQPFVEERADVDGVAVTRVRYWQRLHRDPHRLEYRHPYMAERFARWLDRARPELVHFFHLRFLGADLIPMARQRRIPTAVHLMDYWFVCPAVVLTRRDGALCDGPPDGGLGCVPCIAPELALEVERRGLAPWLARLRDVDPPTSLPGTSVAARAAAFSERPGYLRRRLLEADRIFAPSRFLAGVFARNGFDPARIEVLPYGVDVARLGAARAERGTGRSPLRIGYLGSIAPHKGLHVLIEAFKRVRGDARLRVHGRTSDFGDYAAEVQRLAAPDPRISFAGPFGPERLGAVLSDLDLVAVPSLWYENTPFVVLEAFAAGVPVIATDLGGMTEIVHDGRNGEVFARGDASALAARLQRLVDEPARLARYRDAIPPPRTLAENADDLERRYLALRA